MYPDPVDGRAILGSKKTLKIQREAKKNLKRREDETKTHKKSVLKGQKKRERRPTEPEGNPTISFDLNWHQKQGNDENNRNQKDLSLAGVLEAGIEKGNPKR